MTIASELIKTITSTSKNSNRSLQVEVGPSEIGGCRRRTWNRLNGMPETNQNTMRLSSIMGTAIHTYIQEAFHSQDPFGEQYLLENEFEYDGLKGHVDMYDLKNKEVVDWKTTKKSGLTYFPSKQQRWQVQLYGYLINKNGKEVETVTLVAIPRDGDERDIVYHSEPYSEEMALEALQWLADVKATTDAPAPEKDVAFCKFYCQFYDETGKVGCTGRGKADAEGMLIQDDEVINAAQDYLQVTRELTQLEKVKDGLKSVLEGVNGVTPDGIKVSWSSVAGRKSVDEDKVRELLGDVPLKYGRESYRLNIKGGE